MLICATGHVMVREPHAAALPAPGSEELAMLEFTAIPCQAYSRMSCTIPLAEALDGPTVDLPLSQY